MTIVQKQTSDSGGGASDNGAGDFYDPWRIEPTPAGLIDSPLDFIFAEHHRQRQAALILNMVADGEFDRGGVERLGKFFEDDFAQHVVDEELAFFPILRQRCDPEDKIDPLLDQLAAEHKGDEASCGDVVRRLGLLLAGESLSVEDSRAFRAFAEHVRQHLALENAVLLPIARVRMNDEALKTVSECLKLYRARAARRA